MLVYHGFGLPLVSCCSGSAPSPSPGARCDAAALAAGYPVLRRQMRALVLGACTRTLEGRKVGER
eukprot:9799369-Alexandrium_andersonii.AAC.1